MKILVFILSIFMGFSLGIIGFVLFAQHYAEICGFTVLKDNFKHEYYIVLKVNARPLMDFKTIEQRIKGEVR